MAETFDTRTTNLSPRTALFAIFSAALLGAMALAALWLVQHGNFLVWLTALVITASLLLMNATNHLFGVQHISIAGFWYVTYVAVILVPSFYVFADWPGPFRGSYLFAVESVLLTVPLGIFFANRF